MTIKEFARLCGCNPQTLRYYDHVNLLKPVKVDKWSGYRFYEEEQALAFVKIKNLQKAGFTIDEIKGLLDKDNLVIYQAFEEKIAEGEKRLQEIKDIQRSYQTEMNNIREKINEARKYGEYKGDNVPQFRNKRDIWTINTTSFRGNHYATFPPKLVEICMIAGCPKNEIVLDPFIGSGTVGFVALRHNRKYIGIELNEEYVNLAKNRISEEVKKFNEEQKQEVQKE